MRYKQYVDAGMQSVNCIFSRGIKHFMFQEKNGRIGEKTASSKSQPTLKKIKKLQY